MTLAHVAWRFSRAGATMYHATGPAVPAAARARVEAHAAAAGLAAHAARRGRAGRRPLSREPGRSLLLLQDEPLRAHPRGDARRDRLRHQPRRSRRLPPRLARRSRARRRASVRRGGHRQGERVRAGGPSRPRPISSAFRRSRVSRAAWKRGSPSRRTISRSSMPWRRDSPRASGSEAVLRCRVTHKGIVIELSSAQDAAAAALARDIGAEACRRGRPHVRGRASLPARRGVSAQRPPMDEFRLDWARAGRTGTSEAVLCEPKSAAQIDAIVAHATELGRRLLLTRLGPRKFAGSRRRRASALDYDEATRTAILGGLPAARTVGRVAIVCGGTSDLAGRGRGGAHARVRRRRGDARLRRGRRRLVAADGAARRDPPPSRRHRRGGHGGRALQRARRASFPAR